MSPSTLPETIHSHTDVLIIGAGPAGLMTANTLAAQGLTSFRIIDRRHDKIFTGQADGLQCRTLEVLHSFGMAEEIVRQACSMMEVCFWNPVDGTLKKTGSIPDTIPGISRWHEVTLHQGRIERFFLDNIARHTRGAVQVERGVLPESLERNHELFESTATDDYPLSVTVRQLSEEEATPSQLGKSIPNGLFRSALSPDDTPTTTSYARKTGAREVIHAKYVVGCDGAHSWTRKQIGGEMIGESTPHIWGVLDCIPATDFPDIRMRCAIHSESSGSVMIIPREDGMVRFYIQLSELYKNVDRNSISPEMILDAARRIMHPFTLDVSRRDIQWWTAYVIGQRMCHTFSEGDRIFIGGDASHCHSPKAGQGMNTSMMDGYSLGMKLGAVIKIQSPREILATYQAERRRVAIDLIEFDTRFSSLFSGRLAEDAADEAGISMEEFQAAFRKGGEFASGTNMDYCPSLMTGKLPSTETERSDSKGLVPPGAVSKPQLSAEHCGRSRIWVGKRFNTARVVCQADGRPSDLIDWFSSDGRWRIVVFCGDIRVEAQRVRAERLATGLGRLQARYTPPGLDVDAVLDVLTVGTAPRTSVTLATYPSVLRPHTSRWHQPDSAGPGIKAVSQDYWKVFTDDASYHEPCGDAYKKYGVSPEGAVVVVRPDGYVALLVELEDLADLDAFFARVLLPGDQHIVPPGTQRVAPQPTALVS